MISVFSDLLAEERSRIAAAPAELAAPVEVRSEVITDVPLSQAHFLLDLMGGGMTDAGVRINQKTAFEIGTFVAAVDFVSGILSSLPCNLFEGSKLVKTGRQVRRVASEHPHYSLVSVEPNDEMTWQVFIRTFLVHALAWNGAFAEIQYAPSGYAVGLWPRHPEQTALRRLQSPLYLEAKPWRPWPVRLAAGELVAETSDGLGVSDGAPDGQSRIIPMSDMIYVPGGICFDGRVGKSIVELCRRVLGHLLAVERFGAKYFANYARPGGLLTLPAQQRKEDREFTQKTLLESMSGENLHRTIVATQGSDWKSISNNPQEAQVAEMRSAIRNEIAALFHLAPRYLGDTSKSSRATAEQDSIELLNYTLRPWMNAIKQEFRRKLFPSKVTAMGRFASPYFIDFDTWNLVQPDASTRERFYASGRQWGGLSINDYLETEGRNPIDEDWAEAHWMPVNMTLVTTPVDPRRDLVKPGDPASPAQEPPPPAPEPIDEPVDENA